MVGLNVEVEGTVDGVLFEHATGHIILESSSCTLEVEDEQYYQGQSVLVEFDSFENIIIAEDTEDVDPNAQNFTWWVPLPYCTFHIEQSKLE